MVSNNYFYLNQDVILVQGAKRGSLYDLNTRSVFSIDENSKRLLVELQSGVDLSTFFVKHTDFQKSEVMSYLNKLAETKLGNFWNSQKKETVVVSSLQKMVFPMRFFWFEVTPRCNLRCIHCYNESGPELPHIIYDKEKMIKIMQRMYDYGCKNIHFIGGEPLILGELLGELIICARKIGFNFIEVFSNLTLLNRRMLDIFVDNNISIATSIYGPNGAIHDMITKQPGSFDKTIKAVKQILNAGMNIRTSTIKMKQNAEYIEDTNTFLKKLGINNSKSDIVRPAGRGEQSDLLTEALIQESLFKQPRFWECDRKQFFKSNWGHNCFIERVSVNYNGDIFPCIMEKTLLGNVLEEDMIQIMDKKLMQSVRFMSKDNIEKCKDCEYRYCCFDCRVKRISDKINSAPSDCSYNPYTGVWKT